MSTNHSEKNHIADASKMVQRHPDALEDGTLSKSTAKRVDALRMAQGDGELPGMWSASDFNGGDPDERSHAERSQPPHQDRGEVLDGLKDPTTLHVLMLRGLVAIPTWRSMVDLRGEVPNGEERQLARIAELQEQVAALTEAKQQGRTEPEVCPQCFWVNPKQQGPEGAVAEVRKGSIDNFVFCPDPNSLPVGTKLYTAPQVEAKRQAGEGADHG